MRAPAQEYGVTMAARVTPITQELFDGFANSSAVHVFTELLGLIFDGTLPPGSAVSENDVARRAGVSRTPAREAVQRLRELGIVETSVGRSSRVAVITETRLRQTLVVWDALFAAVLEEVVPVIDDEDLAAMEEATRVFRIAADQGKVSEAAQANFDLYAVVVGRSGNPPLIRTIASIVYLVRLGGQSLPRWIDADVLEAAQHDLIAALRRHDLAASRAAVRSAAGFQLPPDD